MQKVSRAREGGPLAPVSAYVGATAAIAFILAMTFGAIDAPEDKARQWTASQPDQRTQIVSAAGSPAETRLR